MLLPPGAATEGAPKPARRRKQPLAVPANWETGKDVIVALSLDDAAAKEKYGELDIKLPYLRYAKDPS